MKKIYLFLMCICTMLCVFGCSDEETEKKEYSSEDVFSLADYEKYYGELFGQGEVIDIDVELTEEDWQDICTNAEKEEYHTANIVVNGVSLDNVGFRTKGFSSLTTVANSDSNRYGFKVKTDKYVDGQTLNGLDMFVLNGSFSDPSYMREYLTYAASQYIGAITPNVSYANLSINGEAFGFYLFIEAYDDSFVQRNTNDENAVLYKASEETCTLLSTDDTSGFEVDYGDDETNENIKSLIEVLNNTTEDNKEELEAILDVDSVLKAVAVNTVMGNYDSYSGSKAHNYYLLYADGKFTYIGWDYNMSIGGFSEDNGASVSVDVSLPVYNVSLEQRPLIGKLLDIEQYYQRYIEYVKEVTEYLGDVETLVNNIADTIDSYVENDPTAFCTYEQFKSSITASGTDLTDTKNNIMNPGSSSQNMWQKPDDMETPEGMEMPEGMTAPEGMEIPDNMQMGNNMMTGSTLSIVDYLVQRIEFIESSLNE